MYKRNDFRERLLFAVPFWWQDILEMRNIQDQGADELGKYSVEFKRYVDARSPITADAEKLVKWEIMYHIKPEMQKPLDDRRSMVLAKMRGFGIVTPLKVKETAESFKYGEVTVTENAGRVIVTFISTYGVPSFLEDIKKVLRDLIPAHLDIEYRFLYNTYQDVYEQVPSYQVLADSGLTYTELLQTELDFSGGGGGEDPTAIEFFDYLDGTNLRNLSPVRTSLKLQAPITAGSTTIPTGPHSFEEGTYVNIYDDQKQERVEILITNANNIVTRPLQNSYRKGAMIERSTAVLDRGLKFHDWTAYTVRAEVT